MTQARHRQLCLELTPYYHCTSRCVRQAFLCGKDKFTNKNFNHRRDWIEERLLLLSNCFCIEVAGFAIMHNHYHVILKVDQEKAQGLTDEEVLSRWLKIYKGSELAQRFQAGEELTDIEQNNLNHSIKRWRAELSNLSRFMGNLNEYIARKANKEDDCKGRFWQGRFNMQVILDTAALLRTLCYVDLNPVRAKLAKTPEQSKHTSVYRRLKLRTTGLTKFQNSRMKEPKPKTLKEDSIPIMFSEYLKLLDWTGRQLRKGKHGAIEPTAPDIINRLGYTAKQWQTLTHTQVSWKQRALGSTNQLKAYCDHIKQNWIWGISGNVRC